MSSMTQPGSTRRVRLAHRAAASACDCTSLARLPVMVATVAHNSLQTVPHSSHKHPRTHACNHLHHILFPTLRRLLPTSTLRTCVRSPTAAPATWQHSCATAAAATCSTLTVMGSRRWQMHWMLRLSGSSMRMRRWKIGTVRGKGAVGSGWW